VVVDAATRLIISIYVANGCRHDFQMLKDSGILASLPETVAIEADSGYQGLEHLHDAARTPFKKPKNGELTDFQRQYNQHLAASRITVEHVIREMKIFKILSYPYRHHQRKFDLRAKLIASILNLNKDIV
jgi:IS5 family transposase